MSPSYVDDHKKAELLIEREQIRKDEFTEIDTVASQPVPLSTLPSLQGRSEIRVSDTQESRTRLQLFSPIVVYVYRVAFSTIFLVLVIFGLVVGGGVATVFLTSWGWAFLAFYTWLVTGVSLRDGIPLRINGISWRFLSYFPFQERFIRMTFTCTLFLEFCVSIGFWSLLTRMFGTVSGPFAQFWLIVAHILNLLFILWEGLTTLEGLPLLWNYMTFAVPFIYLAWLWIGVYAIGYDWPYYFCTPFLDIKNSTGWAFLGITVGLFIMLISCALMHYGLPKLDALIQHYLAKRRGNSTASNHQSQHQDTTNAVTE